MCIICIDCKTECECPRCPFREGKLRCWPPEITPCTICGMADDRECHDPICAVTEHFLFGGAMSNQSLSSNKDFCQICVEAAYTTNFQYQQFGMYCKKHETEHKLKSNL